MRLQLPRTRSKVLAGSLGAISIPALLFGSKASAQTAVSSAEGLIDAQSIEGLADAELLADGSVRLVYENGTEVIVDASEVQIVKGQILLAEAALAEAAATQGLMGTLSALPTPVLAGGVAAGGGLIAVAASGGGGSDNQAPSISSPTSVSISETSASPAFFVEASDPENDPVSFEISGGSDADRFLINRETGEVRFREQPDFENPSDSGGDNTYELTVTASDGQQTVSQQIIVTVTDENDTAPVFTTDGSAVASENGLVTSYTAAATDAEGDTVTFAIVGGDDSDLFVIDAATGVLTFVAAQDFEAPGDADGDGVYSLVIQASDGVNESTQSVSVALQDVDEEPVITSIEMPSVNENTSGSVFIVEASDPEESSIQFGIAGGADASAFRINEATGELAFISAPNFEVPSDENGDGVFDVVVTASDGSLLTSQSISITVEDIDEEPEFSSPTNTSIEENSSAPVYTAEAADPEGRPILFAIAGGADAAAFTIDEKTGELSFRSPPNFDIPGDDDQDNVYDVIVSSSDGAQSSTQSVAVTVTDVDDRPVFTSATFVSVDENTQGVVYEAEAIDPVQNTVTYSISGGVDAELFSIDSSTGEISFLSPPNFENFDDADSDNIFDLEITASSGGTINSKAVRITVNDVNEAPSFVGSFNILGTENNTFFGTRRVFDPDGDDISFEIAGGADGDRFRIDPNTGTLRSFQGIDFEAVDDRNADGVYEVGVEISDGVSTVFGLFLIEIENVNDEAPEITASTTAFQLPEGSFGTLGTVPAVDADGSEITYSLSGDDSGAFTIDAQTGELSIVQAIDFENPTDLDSDNVYLFDVTVSDGRFTDTVSFSMEVTNVNDVIPTFPSGGVVNVSMDEGTVITGFSALAVDNVEGDTITYSLREGAGDNDLFVIDPNTGALTFNLRPDFEAPADFDQNNEYGVFVVANDGNFEVNQFVSITVNDVITEQAPTFNGFVEVTFEENRTFAGYFPFIVDPQNDPVTFSISGGPDAALFTTTGTLQNNVGEVFFISSPDFETPADANGDNVYEIELTASDGTNNTAHIVLITVDNLNDNAPVFTAPASISIDENDTSFIFDTAVAIDPDGDSLTYSLVGGDDIGNFGIAPGSGDIFFISPPDFESPADANFDNTYQVQVQASDGVNTSVVTFDISVLNANDNAPEISSPLSLDIDEGGFLVDTLTANDLDGSALTWSIVGGIDSAEFVIDGMTGALSFDEDSPDFENPGDADRDNDYEVTIAVTDGVSTDTQTFIVSVNDRLETEAFGKRSDLDLGEPVSTDPAKDVFSQLTDLSDDVPVPAIGGALPDPASVLDNSYWVDDLDTEGWSFPVNESAEQLNGTQTDHHALWA